MNNKAIVNVTVKRRANQAEPVVAKLAEEASAAWPSDFEGDYKDAAALMQDILFDLAQEQEIEFDVLSCAHSCPRSWQMEFTVGNDKAVFPQR